MTHIQLSSGILLATLVVLVTAGCRGGFLRGENEPRFGEQMACPVPDQIEYPDVTRCTDTDELLVAAPRTSLTELPDEFWDLDLDEAIQIGLENSKVIRSIGGQLLRSPATAVTDVDPAIQSSNPIFGIESSLSQFDAELGASLNYQKNDDVFNNAFEAGARGVKQDLVTGRYSLSKTTALGTEFSLGGNILHDNNNPVLSNNSPALVNLFDNSWRMQLEANVRQPLLQGAGLEFNRIAGPNAQPGFRFSNGVLIARINNDISVTQFEQGVRDFVQEVISAYWDLYLAYRSYEAIRTSRDAAYETWQTVKARFDADLQGGEADRESQAREQYFLFEQELVVALNGDSQNPRPGVLQAESNLRRLIGLAQSDSQIIRPSLEPLRTPIYYDWYELVDSALHRRVELRQQLWTIKRRELEWIAARNFLLPQLDAVAAVRGNGFGDDFLGGGSGRFASALKDFATTDHTEWEFGLQYNVPIGFRRAHAGVKHAELNLRRDRAILEEQEKQVAFELGSSVRQFDQAFQSLQFAAKRLAAAAETVQARTVTFEEELGTLDLLLEAQRRLTESEVAYYRILANYSVANEEIFRQSGMLLDNHGIHVQEGHSRIPCRVKCSVTRSKKPVDYRLACPKPVSRGTLAENVGTDPLCRPLPAESP